MTSLKNTSAYDIVELKRGANNPKVVINLDFDPEKSSLFSFSFNGKNEKSSKDENVSLKKNSFQKEIHSLKD